MTQNPSLFFINLLLPKAARGAGFMLMIMLLASCGFRPLYGDYAQGSNQLIAGKMALVQIPQKSEINPVHLRSLLVERITPRGQPSGADYVLDFTLNVTSEGLGLSISEEESRAVLTATARFTLSQQERVDEFFTLSAQVNYSIGDSLYATDEAKADAITRALMIIADDAKLQLAVIIAEQLEDM